MNNFFARLLTSFRIPLATLTIAVFLIVIIEGYINSTINALRIFTLVVLAINIIYLIVNKNVPPSPNPPTTETKPNGDSQEAGKAFDRQ